MPANGNNGSDYMTVDIFGLRNYQKQMIPLIIFNRISRRLFGKVRCVCGKYVYFSRVWSVLSNDTFLCDWCMSESTGDDWYHD